MGIVYNEMTKETERLFQNSKNVKYWPYIGKGYFKCKTKILVLGESHYLTDPSRIKEMENYSGWTNEVVIWIRAIAKILVLLTIFLNGSLCRKIHISRDIEIQRRCWCKMFIQKTIIRNKAQTMFGKIWLSIIFSKDRLLVDQGAMIGLWLIMIITSNKLARR